MKQSEITISQTQALILECLTASFDYSESFEIANATGLSRRQVLREMGPLKDLLEQLGYTLESKRAKGYRISESSRIQRLQELIRSEKKKTITEGSPKERVSMIAEYLIMNDDHYTRMDDLANNLYISRSTLKNDLADVENVVLAKWEAAIESNTRRGIRIVGDEYTKREIYCDSCFGNFTRNDYHYRFLDAFLFSKSSLERKTLDIFRHYGIAVSDIAFVDILLYLIVACMRIRAHKYILSSASLERFRAEKEINAAGQIAALLEKELGLQFTDEEINVIAIKIMAKESAQTNHIFSHMELAETVARHVEKEIFSELGIQLDGAEFRQRFLNYIDTTITIVELHEKIRHPFYSSVKENYPLAYEMALITSAVFEKETGYHLSSSHIATYTVFFNTWILSRRAQRRKVLLICGLGTAIADSIRNELHTSLGKYLSIDRTCMYHELNSLDLYEYDFIISMIPIYQNLPLPVIPVSPAVDEDDIERIRSYLIMDTGFFRPELLFSASLYMRIEGKVIFEQALSKTAEMICAQFPSLKQKSVEGLLALSKDESRLLKNGILVIEFKKRPNNITFASALLLHHPVKFNAETVNAIITVSSESGDTAVSLEEASRLIPEEELLRNVHEKESSYRDFIGMYLDE